MSICEHIIQGLGTKELSPRGRKGTSRAAIRAWLVKHNHVKDGPMANSALRNALKKALEQGSVIAEGPQRFRLNVAKRDADLKAKKAKIAAKKSAMALKKKAQKDARMLKKKAATAKRMAKKKAAKSKKPKNAKKAKKKTMKRKAAKKAKKPAAKKAKKTKKPAKKAKK